MENKCPHLSFIANTRVIRLTDDNNQDLVTGFKAEVEIHCANCAIKFKFLGMPHGMHCINPTINIDGTELRVNIEPVDGINSYPSHLGDFIKPEIKINEN